MSDAVTKDDFNALGVRVEELIRRVQFLTESINATNERFNIRLSEQEKTLLDRLDVVETAMKENMAFRLDVAALRYDVRRRREKLDALEARMTELEGRAILSFRAQLEADR